MPKLDLQVSLSGQQQVSLQAENGASTKQLIVGLNQRKCNFGRTIWGTQKLGSKSSKIDALFYAYFFLRQLAANWSEILR